MNRTTAFRLSLNVVVLMCITCITCITAATSAAQSSAAIRHGLDTVRFAPALSVDLRKSMVTPSGAYWRDLGVGTGDLTGDGNLIALRYQLLLPDGTRIGASVDEAFEFRLGDGAAMPGMDEGVRGMRAGGRRQIVLPIEAQGQRGADGIAGVPSGSPIVLIVELLKVG